MAEWKHKELHDRASNWYNSHGYSERSKLCMASTSQQLLTTRQLINLRKRQHKKEIAEMQGWENNIAEHLKKLLKENGVV